MKTMQEIAKSALQVQDACNLVGVTQSFAQVTLDLKELLPGAGTKVWNEHPICVLYTTQLAHLSGCGMTDLQVYSDANDACIKLAKGPLPLNMVQPLK